MSTRKLTMIVVLSIVFIMIVMILFFPTTKFELDNNASQIIQQLLSEDVKLIKSIEAPGSIFFLIETTNEKTYMIRGERALFFSRYRMLHPIMLKWEQTFSFRDLGYNQVIILL